MSREELERIRGWANDKLATGEEPPWAWYQYMKLRETLDAILDGMSASATLTALTTGNSPQSEQRSGTHLRLVDATYQQDSAQRHPDIAHLPLPM
jgi:hypothetical protein